MFRVGEKLYAPELRESFLSGSAKFIFSVSSYSDFQLCRQRSPSGARLR